LPTESLVDTVGALATAGGDVVLAAHCDDKPVSAYLIRRQALRAVPERGYIDFKEQALEQIARQFQVRVVRRPTPGGIPIQTARTYLSALRLYHGLNGQTTANGDWDVIDDHAAHLAVAEAGAEIGRGVTLHDAVALRGCRIGDGATIVRSVIAGGAWIRPQSVIVDRIVEPGEML
jgi:NDP-sugar pyrophosphorylase family protein